MCFDAHAGVLISVDVANLYLVCVIKKTVDFVAVFYCLIC
jgi:hypothetical protein